jgi:hypothetical protein
LAALKWKSKSSCAKQYLCQQAYISDLLAYIIFAVFDFCLIFVIYFTMVETKQLSLEEIDNVFKSSNARKNSIALAKQHRQMRQSEQRKASAV